MKKPGLDLYTDYLLSTFGAATATGLSAMVDGDVSHDQVTRFLSAQEYTSKDLWQQVKSTVRSIERDDGVLIFDYTIQEKAWTDENELMCWHFDHCSGRTVRGINRKPPAQPPLLGGCSQRQQLIQPAIRPGRQLLQRIFQPRTRLDTVQFCCRQQTLDRRRTPTRAL